MRCRFSFTSFQSSASPGASLRSTIGFQALASSALSGMKSFWPAGTSSSAKMASTGHSGTQSVQSMHSSGSITSMLGPSRKQSTGQTSTQSVYLHFTQDSVTTYAIWIALREPEDDPPDGSGEKTAILPEGAVAPQPTPLPGCPDWPKMLIIEAPPWPSRAATFQRAPQKPFGERRA